MKPLNGADLDILLQPSKVQTDRLFIEVPVLANFETGVAEDWSMVSPGRRREINNLGGGEETAQECASDSKSSSSRYRLGDRNLLGARTRV